jgi:hypothetical protein
MATLGGQRILFKSVRRLGYRHPEPMVISFCHSSASLKLRRLSGFQKLPTGLQSSSDSFLNPLLLAAITDMLHL